MSDNTRKRSSGSRPRRKKAVVTTDGNAESSQSSQPSPSYSSVPVRERTRHLSETITEFSSDDDNASNSKSCPLKGFNDVDLEKPYFSTPSHLEAYEPLVLSSGDEKPCQIPATINRCVNEIFFFLIKIIV